METLLIKEAQKNLEKGELTSAHELVQQTLKSDPHHPEAHFLCGMISYRRGELDGALKSFKKAIEFDPGHTDALLSLSILYNDLGLYELGAETWASLQKACQAGSRFQDKRINSKIANQHIGMAQVYSQHRRYDEALEEYTKAQQLAPHEPQIKVEIARLYLEKGQPQQSIDLLQRLITKHADCGEAIIELGLALCASGDKVAALETWKKALSLPGYREISEKYIKMMS